MNSLSRLRPSVLNLRRVVRQYSPFIITVSFIRHAGAGRKSMSVKMFEDIIDRKDIDSSLRWGD
jgi:hypothetical protein